MRGFGFGYFLTANALAKEIAHFFLGRSSCFSISRAMTLVLLSVNLCRRNTPFLIPTSVMSQCPKVALSIFWVLIVFYLVWPIALAVAGFWILLMPFEACFPFVLRITSFFERLVTWPREFGHAIMSGTESFPEP